MFSFFAGCLVYELRRHSRRAGSDSEPDGGRQRAGVHRLPADHPLGRRHYTFPLLAAIVIYVFSFDQGFVSTDAALPALQKLGLWSYSIYMIHVFVFVMRRWPRPISATSPSRSHRLAQ